MIKELALRLFPQNQAHIIIMHPLAVQTNKTTIIIITAATITIKTREEAGAANRSQIATATRNATMSSSIQT